MMMMMMIIIIIIIIITMVMGDFITSVVAHPEGVLTGPALNDHPQMVLDGMLSFTFTQLCNKVLLIG